MKVSDWLAQPKTRQVLAKMEDERRRRLEAILSSKDKNEAAMVTIGFSEALKFIKGLEESDVPDDSD